MAEKKTLELFLFTDEPVRDLEHDHLALKPFSSMVAAAALTNRGPFNIGVFSGWGQGKTTVLRQAEALIKEQEKPNVITAWVNAWQYEHEAHPIVPLLAIIINEITKAIDARKTVSEKENVALTKTFGDLKRALRSIAYGFSAKAGATIPGFANLEIGFVAKDMIDRDEKLSSDRDPLLDQSLYYHAYERLEKFREELDKSEPVDHPKIIVFIDDLDRCLPSKALHLLESLKLVLAQPGFIFVLGVDRHVIDSFLTKRYHEDFGILKDMGHGKQYMDKIIQLPLDLPHHQNRFEKYIDSLTANAFSEYRLPAIMFGIFSNTEDSSRFRAALAAGCDRNPRTLIRTLNYLLTDLFLRESGFIDRENDPFDTSAEFLQFAAVSRITRLTLGDERLYRKLVDSNWGCEELSNSIEGKKTVWESTYKDSEYGFDYPGGEKAFENARSKLDPFRSIITQAESLNELFSTPLGQRWLKEHHKRKAIEGFLATREDPGKIPDETSVQIINAAIRKKLDLPEGAVGDADRKKILKMDLRGTQVSDLTALQSLTNLQALNFDDTPVTEVSALLTLTNLEALSLGETQVSDVTALQSLTSLKELYLENTQVSDVTALYWLKDSLKILWLHNTPAARNEATMAALREALPNTEIKP